jgi:hypothetical protein
MKEAYHNIAAKISKDESLAKYASISEDGELSIKLQNGPIKEVGENGTQIDSLGKIWDNLIYEFNLKYPCIENTKSRAAIQKALKYQEDRTRNRIARNVEGKNEK